MIRLIDILVNLIMIKSFSIKLFIHYQSQHASLEVVRPMIRQFPGSLKAIIGGIANLVLVRFLVFCVTLACVSLSDHRHYVHYPLHLEHNWG